MVAFEDTLQYQIGKVGGMKSFVFGGEGLVMHFSGQGSIWIQTRAVPALAGIIIPYVPKNN